MATTILATACATSSAQRQPEQAIINNRPQTRALEWPVKTREHVDLWLHGFALVQVDSALVPYFRRGYRDELTVLKNQANVFTQLDANIDRLRAGLTQNPVLINAQFVPLYFDTMDQMRDIVTRFVRDNGAPSAKSEDEAVLFRMLASYFPNRTDQAWLSLFSSSLWDESAQFYHNYWTQQARARDNVVDSVQGMWQSSLRPRIQRFLSNTQQRNGDIILSLPLQGEGRTLNAGGVVRSVVAVPLPARPSDAAEALYVIAHEVVSPVASNAIHDNTTPAQQRDGTADQLASPAAVRGGLILLEKMAPEFADGYARYYVTATGRTPNANPRAQLIALFPLPDVILSEMTRQLDMVQGGI